MGHLVEKNKESIMNGKTSIGIELGSTRIKAILIGEDNAPIAAGSHDWSNSYVDGIWTYSLEEVWKGLQDSYQKLAEDVKNQYGITLETVGAIGFSAMMHGYMVFDASDNLLVPFRTWRNNITGEASEFLTGYLNYPIPQRWSIAHLYQAILKEEPHVNEIAFLTSLAGYVHYKLTGEKCLGIGEASGMFPTDLATKNYNRKMVEQFNELLSDKGMPWKFDDIMPKSLLAGENAGYLTEEGAKLLDVSGNLKAPWYTRSAG